MQMSKEWARSENVAMLNGGIHSSSERELHWLSDLLQVTLRSLCVCQSFSHVQLFATPWTVACQAPLSMRFPRQEDQNGLPVPSPGNLPDIRIKPESPTLAGRYFAMDLPGKTQIAQYYCLSEQEVRLCSVAKYIWPKGSEFQKKTKVCGSFYQPCKADSLLNNPIPSFVK